MAGCLRPAMQRGGSHCHPPEAIIPNNLVRPPAKRTRPQNAIAAYELLNLLD
jgi:hypothetical protein